MRCKPNKLDDSWRVIPFFALLKHRCFICGLDIWLERIWCPRDIGTRVLGYRPCICFKCGPTKRTAQRVWVRHCSPKNPRYGEILKGLL